jgi:hypothetical protein
MNDNIELKCDDFGYEYNNANYDWDAFNVERWDFIKKFQQFNKTRIDAGLEFTDTFNYKLK